MRSLAIVVFFIFSACSSKEAYWASRGPASVGGACDRQSLGVDTTDNKALVQFNSKRTDIVGVLLKSQLDKLKGQKTTPSLQLRIESLQAQLQKISPTETRPSDEPIEVSWKLNRAVDAYLKDAVIDEQAHALTAQEQERLNYVRESVLPHMAQVEYWMPEFCKNIGTHPSSETFKGL